MPLKCTGIRTSCFVYMQHVDHENVSTCAISIINAKLTYALNLIFIPDIGGPTFSYGERLFWSLGPFLLVQVDFIGSVAGLSNNTIGITVNFLQHIHTQTHICIADT